MSDKKEVIICLGSSCFARGNKKSVKAIETYLKEHNLKDKVFFHGGHCFGNCENGPILKINQKEFQGVSESNIIDILSQELDQ